MRKLSKEQINEIIFQKNKPVSELAKQFNVTKMSIYYHQNPEVKRKMIEYNRKWYQSLSKERKREILSRKREYQRIYQKNRYHNDPIFRTKQIERVKKSQNIVKKEDKK